MTRQPQHSDVAVVGGGPCGALAALLLARAGRRVVLLEARRADARIQDARSLALSWASVQCLEQVGAWPVGLSATAIDHVHVSQQGSWGRTVLDAADLGLPHLGMVVDYPDVTHALDQALESAGVQVLWGCKVSRVQTLARYAEIHYQSATDVARLTCRLAVLAEGGALIDELAGVERREIDYQQSALLAQVVTERAQQGVAYERFSRQGPLALLPRSDGYMLVWTRAHADAERLMQAGSEQLARELQLAFGERQGRILSVATPAVFPLRMRRASQVVSQRVALIGNAAQTLHPVAAQGLNLGIRDACALARTLENRQDPGDEAVLATYAARRRADSRAVIGFTHGLMRLFEPRSTLAGLARGAGMNLLDTLPALRKRLAGHLVFGVGAQA